MCIQHVQGGFAKKKEGVIEINAKSVALALDEDSLKHEHEFSPS